MWKRDRWVIVAAAVLLPGLAVLWWGGQTLWAQPKPKEPAGPYQYVGVQQTIARVDSRTGRIEVLYKRGDPKASLLMPDSMPWEWREVRVREPRRGNEPEEPRRGNEPEEPPAPEKGEGQD